MNTRVAVVMGSQTDWEVMSRTVETLKSFNVDTHVQVLSAHRMPEELMEFGRTAQANGFATIIAGAGGAAHLPGMLAAQTLVPVLGVPIPTAHLAGHDSLYSIVQMPAGTPVATFAIGVAGAINSALFAVALLAAHDAQIHLLLEEYRARRHDEAAQTQLPGT